MTSCLKNIALIGVCSVVLPHANATGIYDNRRLDVAPSAIRLAEVGETVLEDGFSDAAGWKLLHCNELISVKRNGGSLTVSSVPTKPKGVYWETYWVMVTKHLPLTKQGDRFVLSFLLSSDFAPAYSCANNEEEPYWNQITWFDGHDKKIGISPLAFSVMGDGEAEVRCKGKIPSGAKAYELSLGCVRRALPPAKNVVYRKLSLQVFDGSASYESKGTFSSDVVVGGDVNWSAGIPAGTSIGFQIATGVTPQAAWSAPFVGPDGTAKSFYTKPFACGSAFMRYRVGMMSDGKSTPVLESVTIGSRKDSDWSLLRDGEPPYVHLVSESPFSDANAVVRFKVRDESIIAKESIHVVVDGADYKASVDDDGTGIAVFPPANGWTNGLHTAQVTVADFRGRISTAKKLFYRGSMPRLTPNVSLRGDGVTLVNGKPFFPIGVYGVKRGIFNAYNLDRAISHLKSVGFNFVQTYWHTWENDYRNALRKYDMKTIEWMRDPKALLSGERDNPSVISWYVADDTSDNTSPEALLDIYDGLRAVDPTRFVCHASDMWSGTEVSNYRAYADKADIFIAESYPIRAVDGEAASNCVAGVVRDVLKHREETRIAGGGRPRAIWPVVQYFKGWTQWKRMPTPEEERAMCLGAIAAGAKGIMWYTYEEALAEEKPENRRYGITATEESWRTITALVAEINGLVPMLVSDSPEMKVNVEILEGPGVSAYDVPTVVAFAKRMGDKISLLAVNTTREKVRARISPVGGRPTERVIEPIGIVNTQL